MPHRGILHLRRLLICRNFVRQGAPELPDDGDPAVVEFGSEEQRRIAEFCTCAGC